MGTKLAIAMAAVGVLASAAPMWAHHAFAAEFDSTKPLKLHGTVTKMEWINPHAWIHIDVKNPDGTVTSWMVEGEARTLCCETDLQKPRCPRARRSW